MEKISSFFSNSDTSHTPHTHQSHNNSERGASNESVQTRPDRRKSRSRTTSGTSFIHPNKHNTAEIDVKSIDYIKSQDLSRKNVSFELVSKVKWWPDEIVVFLEILSVAYTNFINSYMCDCNIFDEPIRRSIYFMNQKKYDKMNHIRKFIKNCNFNIPDNYLSIVISEDNCYMKGLEDRTRSVNENKHYLLVRALDQLLESGQISEGDLILGKNNEFLIRLYLCIYYLKNGYAVIDDFLKTILVSFIQKIDIDMSLDIFSSDIIKDLDVKILTKIKNFDDHKLYTKFNILKDLLLYMNYNTLQFDYVFNHNTNYSDKYIGSEKLFCSDRSLNTETISRIEYIYKYHINILHNRYIKDNLLLQNIKIESIMSNFNDFILPEPIYYMNIIRSNLSSNPDFKIFVIKDTNDKDSKKVTDDVIVSRHIRKYSVDALISPRKNKIIKSDARQDYPVVTKT